MCIVDVDGVTVVLEELSPLVDGIADGVAIDLFEFLAPAKTVGDANCRESVFFTSDNVRGAVAKHKRGGGLESFVVEEISDQIPFICQPVLEFGTVNSFYMAEEMELVEDLSGEKPGFECGYKEAEIEVMQGFKGFSNAGIEAALVNAIFSVVSAVGKERLLNECWLLSQQGEKCFDCGSSDMTSELF